MSCIKQPRHQLVLCCLIIGISHPEMRSARDAKRTLSKRSGLKTPDGAFHRNRFGSGCESKEYPTGPSLAHTAVTCTWLCVVLTVNAHCDFATKTMPHKLLRAIHLHSPSVGSHQKDREHGAYSSPSVGLQLCSEKHLIGAPGGVWIEPRLCGNSALW